MTIEDGILLLFLGMITTIVVMYIIITVMASEDKDDIS
jgi:phage shock protein PspC (stress-responsive transcriptional regulator)|tara:strand:- start:589 stop:702 length:114 start_codon:yes stop_codon:yes gene_type:complete